MYKVKVFREMSFILEETINNWLKENNNISIINTSHVHLASSDSIYTILYRDGEKKEDLK